MSPAGRRRLDRLTLALTLVAFGALLMPMRESPTLQLLFNAAHIPGFALLALFWAEDLLSRDWPLARRLVTVALLGLLLAAATEVLQALVPGRYADLGDMARNALGIALGLSIHASRPGLLASRLARD